jgi:hypothetical protein
MISIDDKTVNILPKRTAMAAFAVRNLSMLLQGVDYPGAFFRVHPEV